METNILAAIMEKPMTTQQIPPDIMLLEFPLVNACLVGAPNAKSGEWILVGAGMAHTGKAILQAAESRFGKGSKPGAVKEKELNGPPAYFTIDWKAAESSVRTLKDLNPALTIPSHGLPMGGEELNTQLSSLVNNFNQAAVPKQGKYVQ